MASSKIQPKKRNKTLHRFYEPLVLLHVLDSIQGGHIPRQKDNSSHPDHASRTDLRRRFLETMAYACDYEKGGNTITAIVVTCSPLTYHIACNTRLGEKNAVIPFLESLLQQLRVEGCSKTELERSILEQCVMFSEKRISTYWQFLQSTLTSCRETTQDTKLLDLLGEIDTSLSERCSVLVELCIYCSDLIKSDQLNLIQDKASKSEDFGNRRNPFADLRHFIGRLGSHVQNAKVLVAGARRFPVLVEKCLFNVVNGPPSLSLPPPPRTKLTLPGIAKRMISGDEELTRDVVNRLEKLNHALGIQQLIFDEYGQKNLKARVHAELILLDYCHQHRDKLHFYDGDRYIAASKPACYCCSLYIREHPGDFTQPATHQKIYLNWLPPTSGRETDVDAPNSDAVIHELRMLNIMVKAIRKRTIEQLKAQTGGEKRYPHHDTVTWETLPKQPSTVRHDELSLAALSIDGDVETQISDVNDEADTVRLSSLFTSKLALAEDSDDSETGGGVELAAHHI